MFMICPACEETILESGLAGEVYHMICEFYFKNEEPIAFYEPYFASTLHYLEINNYVVTMEMEDLIVLAKPKVIALDDNESFICCSGKCDRNVIDLKTDTA